MNRGGLATNPYMSAHSPDNVYLNIQFPGSLPNALLTVPPSGNYDPIPIEYSSTRNSPIVEVADDYYCTVVDFTVPLNSIPDIVCPIVPNSSTLAPSEANILTPCIVGIMYGNPNIDTSYFGTSLLYINQTPYAVPIQDKSYQIVTPALFINNYGTFINMINIALETSWVSSGLAALFPTVWPPSIMFDEDTQLLSLVISNVFIAPTTAPATSVPRLYMNNNMKQYLDSFNLILNGYNAKTLNAMGVLVPTFNDWYFDLYITPAVGHRQIYPNQAQIYVYPGDSNVYFQYIQPYSSMNVWTASNRIIFTSNTIPISKEYVQSLTANNAQNNLLPVLIDYTIDLTELGNNRTIAQFKPGAQYRLVDLESSRNIQNIDVRAFWQDLYGNYWPLLMNPFQQASIKIAFVKKDLYIKMEENR